VGKWTEDNRQEIDEAKDNRGKPIAKVFSNISGLSFYECPLGWITQDTNTLIHLLTLEENPTKIYPGNWIDQPQWWIEAKQIYNQEKHKWQQAQKA
jgi:hypothetical protein